MLRALLIAVQFLTRLPLPKGILKEADYRPERLGQSVLFYPVAGLLIGGLLYLLVYAQQQIFSEVSPLVMAAIILFCWVLLTGALHLDGLADSADAWVGGYGDRDKTLAIMKDPYCGPAGVAVIVIALIIKFAALSVLVKQAWPGLLLAPLLGRASIILLFLTTPYVRQQGIGASQAQYMPRIPAWLVLSGVMILCAYCLRWQAIWLIVILVTVFFLLRQLMLQRLGGTTGDTAGALLEIMEIMVLLVLVV